MKCKFSGKHSTFTHPLTNPSTLMDMRTDLTAVPHAGLGFQFLRVHWYTYEPLDPGGLQEEVRPKKEEDRSTNRQVDVVACKSAAT